MFEDVYTWGGYGVASLLTPLLKLVCPDLKAFNSHSRQNSRSFRAVDNELSSCKLLKVRDCG